MSSCIVFVRRYMVSALDSVFDGVSTELNMTNVLARADEERMMIACDR